MKRAVRSSPRNKLKRRCLNAPKLRPSICNELLKYTNTTSMFSFNEESDNIQVLYSMISEKFRHQVKKFNDGNVSMYVDFLLNDEAEDDYNNTIHIGESPPFFIIANKKLNNILALLKMTEFPTLKFRIIYDGLGENETRVRREMFNGFANFCRGLGDIETLKKIDIDMTRCGSYFPLMPAFLELLILSKKPMSIESKYFDSLSLFKGDIIPFDSWESRGLLFEKCTSQVFKTPTKELKLAEKYSYSPNTLKFHQLKEFGLFQPNPYLEHLDINVDLMHPDFDMSEIDGKSLPEHMEFFELLKQLNPNLALTLRSNETARVKTPDEAAVFYEKQRDRAKKLIGMAQELGFKINEFYANPQFTLVNVKNVDTFMRNFDKKNPAGFGSEYKGVEIKATCFGFNRDG